MAKTDNQLVELNIGWNARYLMPVEAATQIMSILVKSGAIKLDYDYKAGKSVYYGTTPEASVQVFKEYYDPDIPADEKLRRPYFDWLKTKHDLIGDSYEVQTYKQYLAEKEQS